MNGKKVDLVAKTNGAQFDFTAPCTEHKWDEGKVTTEPTCEKEGIKTYTCKNCQTIKTESIKALGHDYSKDWTVDQEATCTNEGSKSHHCTRCDSKKDVTSISKKEYEWDNGTVTKESTNKETGIKTYKCKNCNETKTEIIPVKKDESNVDSETPVIDLNSIKLSTKSATKGDTVKISMKITDNVGITEASFQLTNFETKKDLRWPCLKFNEKTGLYEYSLEVTDDLLNGHWYISGIQVRDAANNLGIETFLFKDTHWLTVTKNDKDVHQWDESEIVSKPTCTKEGSIIYTCSICQTTKTEVVKTLGHDYSTDWTIDKTATCTNEGSKSHHCFRCDSKKDVIVIPPKNHVWIVESNESVHSGKDKEILYRCSECKNIKKDIVTGSWNKNKNGVMYLYSDGSYENSGFKVIDSKTYYFQNNGDVKTDWLLENNAWYYFNKDGIMQTGWSGPGRQFYFDDAGKMLEKQFTPDGYYVGSIGAYVRNGWVLENGKYYYMNSAGRMVKSAWVGVYYLDSNGAMAANCWKGDRWCGNDGAYVKNKWIRWNGEYYYLDSNGIYVRDEWVGAYYLKSNGAMATNCWIGERWCGSDGKYVKNAWVDDNRYYVGPNGEYVPGKWQKDSKGWWYQAGNTYAKNITLNIGGINYTFNSNGYVI